MKLLTKEIEKKFEKTPFGTNDHGIDSKLLVKFFNPYGAGTWLITEAEKQENGDWLMYGLCHIFEREWGYVSMRELENTRVNVWGCRMPLERDLYAHGTIKENAPEYAEWYA